MIIHPNSTVERNTTITIITKSDKMITLSTFSRYFMLASLYPLLFSYARRPGITEKSGGYVQKYALNTYCSIILWVLKNEPFRAMEERIISMKRSLS